MMMMMMVKVKALTRKKMKMIDNSNPPQKSENYALKRLSLILS